MEVASWPIVLKKSPRRIEVQQGQLLGWTVRRRKARVGRNALRHGLTIRVGADPALRPEVERLARAIAGPALSPRRLQNAIPVAEAEIDLRRIRLEKTRLFERELAVPDDTLEQTTDMVSSPLVTDKDALVRLLPRLLALDRYETKALARRERAICRFDGD